MTQKIMMVVEQPRPVVMQTTEFVRGGGSSDYDALINKPSVNGVTLDGDKTTAELGLPTKTSDLENDSGFVNAAEAATAAPVQSVNGKTGAVVLSASDVGAGTYSKPSGGIPATDLAAGVIPSLSGYATEEWVQQQGYLKQHQSLADYQTKAITDTGGYYTTDTVDGALQEIGAELAGINTLIGSGVIT